MPPASDVEELLWVREIRLFYIHRWDIPVVSVIQDVEGRDVSRDA